VTDELTLADAQAADAAKLEDEEVLTDETASEDAAEGEEAPNPNQYRYQDGFWHGIPNYKCPHCNLREVSRNPVVAATRINKHIETRHPTSWLESFTEEGG
jgi:hypothetical protein